ncbi:MAG: DsrE family protein [Chloroflexi bacterium]|nr:DsrE family protein [Chloroflexota bacterium]
MASLLFLISSPPASSQAQSALRLASQAGGQGHQITLFLLQDAVLASLKGSRQESRQLLEQGLAQGWGCSCLAEDLALRGYGEGDLLPGVGIAGYPELVEHLMERHDRALGAF